MAIGKATGMNLNLLLNKMPLLRPWGVPANIGESCLIAGSYDIPHIGKYLSDRPWLRVNRVMLIDHDPASSPVTISAGDKKIPVEGMENIGFLPEYAKIFLLPESSLASFLCRRLTTLGIEEIWFDGPLPVPFGQARAIPDFYHRHAPQLKRVFEMLDDWPSRLVYAARIKAIMTGTAGYIPLSSHVEYMHPDVHPEAGDVMIDGGISDMVGAQLQFVSAVGPNGRIFGFEPIPWMAESAASQLAGHPQYKIVNKGLASSDGSARFASLRDSSHLASANDSAAEIVECGLASIDSFVEQEGLSRVDCIKLDVEGAELDALSGAKQTISHFRPKLIICLYHKPEDMITIPLFIKNLAPEYKIQIAHSSCGLTDTILYAHMPEGVKTN